MPKGKTITEKQKKILALKKQQPGASVREIARQAQCDNAYATRVLANYGIDYQKTQDYKNHQADILSGLQARLLSDISNEDLQKATIQQRVVSAGILYDKEQALRGNDKSTMPLVIINKIQIGKTGEVEGNENVLDV